MELIGVLLGFTPIHYVIPKPQTKNQKEYFHF